MSTQGLSYIVPAYNEEGAITATIVRLKAALAGLDLPSEIIVVNDGSADGTRQRAEEHEGVRVLNHPINIGYGSAIKTGIRAASYDWIGIVDADGTYDIEELPALVRRMQDGFDMVVAARQNVLDLDRPLKRFFRRILIGFLYLVIGARVQDPNSGFRLFTKDLALMFLPFLCNTFSFTTSLTVFALGQRKFVHYVPMRYAMRVGKSKVRHFRDSLRMLQLVLEGITYFNPMKFYVLAALALTIVFLLPSFALIACGATAAGLAWLAFGCTSALLAGLGMLGTIVRTADLDRGARGC